MTFLPGKRLALFGIFKGYCIYFVLLYSSMMFYVVFLGFHRGLAFLKHQMCHNETCISLFFCNDIFI